eukprot:m.333917 g.333917  ORF g.333917 m.333917 type:complete len:181 (-) comp17244_c0_seq1:80-622(-)
MFLTVAIAGLFLSTPNPNCESRGHCIPTYPKYPDQHTLCLASDDGKWGCAAMSGVFGSADYSFGPNATRDFTMMGGMGTDLRESFTVHRPTPPVYGVCEPVNPAVWTITRELSYLNGTGPEALNGTCTSTFFDGSMMIASFNHSCAVLTQITVGADAQGKPKCFGCRCCDTAFGCPILPA